MKPFKDNPCIDCVAPKRHPGCHSTCGDYIVAKAFHEVEKDEERLKKGPDIYVARTARKRREESVKRHLKFKRYNKGNTQ